MFKRTAGWLVSKMQLSAFSKDLLNSPDEEEYIRGIIAQRINGMISSTVLDDEAVSRTMHKRDELKRTLEFFSEGMPGPVAGQMARLYSKESQQYWNHGNPTREYIALRFLAGYFYIMSQSPVGGIIEGQRMLVRNKFFQLLIEYEYALRKLFIDFENMLLEKITLREKLN